MESLLSTGSTRSSFVNQAKAGMGLLYKHLRITGSRVKVILMNGWILPIGGASEVEGQLDYEV